MPNGFRNAARGFLLVGAVLWLLGCDCGGQTGGFLCGGSDSTNAAGEVPLVDAGADASGSPNESVFDFDSACPLGFSAAQVLNQVSRETHANLQWQLNVGPSAQTEVSTNISYTGQKIVFVDYGDAICESSLRYCNYLRVPVEVNIRTADGRFDDTWQADIAAYPKEKRLLRSTTPLDLRQVKGSYPTGAFIQSIFGSDTSLDGVISIEAQVEITYLTTEVKGVINGTACRALDQSGSPASCKSSVMASW